jgi:hypothetical protein
VLVACVLTFCDFDTYFIIYLLICPCLSIKEQIQ